jgi:hypothetical protein
METLSLRPALRLPVLLAVNAWSVPYANLVHDAQLYAFQVLNRVHGDALASDLFLRFGSQDRYTPFSLLAAPVARLAGVEATFFLLFLVSSAALVVALDRLVSLLVDDRLLRTATAIFVAMSSMPYAGLSVFFVREGFYTPRMTASALAVFALTCALEKRYAVGLVLGVLATLAHPLMGAPAVIVVLGAMISGRLSRAAAWLTALSVALAGLAALTYRPLGQALFGVMDDEWLELVRHASPYVVLEGWTASDWARLVTVAAVVASASKHLHDDAATRSKVVLWALVTAVVGLAVMAVATNHGYRVLIQAQPYRAVWLLHLLHIPAVAVVGRVGWQRGGWGRVAAAVALSTLIVTDFVVFEIVFAAALLCALAMVDPRVRSARDPDALALAIPLSVAGGAALWGGTKLVVAVHRAAEVIKVAGMPLYIKTLVGCVPRVVWFGVVVLGLAWLLQRMPSRRLVVAAAMLAILPHVTALAVHAVPILQDGTEPHARDARFVRRFVESRSPRPSAPPTVYAGPWGDLGLVWLGVGARNYFGPVVVIFNRETAIETRRRAGVVRAFELERYQAMGDLAPPVVRPLIAYLFGSPERASLPTRTDLAAVCAPGEAVDYVVLSRDIDALATSDNARVFVFECARVRAGTG